MAIQLTIRGLLLPAAMTFACSVVLAQSSVPLRPGDMVGPRAGDTVGPRVGDTSGVAAGSAISAATTSPCRANLSVYQNPSFIQEQDYYDCGNNAFPNFASPKFLASSLPDQGEVSTFSTNDGYGWTNHVGASAMSWLRYKASGIPYGPDAYNAVMKVSIQHEYQIGVGDPNLGFGYAGQVAEVRLYNAFTETSLSQGVDYRFVGSDWYRSTGHTKEVSGSRHVSYVANNPEGRKFLTAPKSFDAKLAAKAVLDFCESVDGVTFDEKKAILQKARQAWDAYRDPYDEIYKLKTNYTGARFTPDQTPGLTNYANVVQGIVQAGVPDFQARNAKLCATVVMMASDTEDLPFAIDRGGVINVKLHTRSKAWASQRMFTSIRNAKVKIVEVKAITPLPPGYKLVLTLDKP